MKKITFLILALITTNIMAVLQLKAETEELGRTQLRLNQFSADSSGNWVASFTLKDGSIIIHEPGYTMLNCGKGVSVKPESPKYIGMMSWKQEIILPMNEYHGYPLNDGLFLNTNSSRVDFVNALIRSGIYDATEEEFADYEASANWTETFTLKNGVQIIHTPEALVYSPGTKYEKIYLKIITRQIKEMSFLKPLRLFTKSTRSEFLASLESVGAISRDCESISNGQRSRR